jgi:hypothetical protein
MTDRAFIVVPFERDGITIRPRQALIFERAAQAQLVAPQIAARVAGVAILKREIDPNSGADTDTLIAGIGVVPPQVPSGVDWTLKLH